MVWIVTGREKRFTNHASTTLSACWGFCSYQYLCSMLHLVRFLQYVFEQIEVNSLNTAVHYWKFNNVFPVQTSGHEGIVWEEKGDRQLRREIEYIGGNWVFFSASTFLAVECTKLGMVAYSVVRKIITFCVESVWKVYHIYFIRFKYFYHFLFILCYSNIYLGEKSLKLNRPFN